MYHVVGIVGLIIAVGAISGIVRARLEERRANRRP
jgi:hypothetical protein